MIAGMAVLAISRARPVDRVCVRKQSGSAPQHDRLDGADGRTKDSSLSADAQ
jgi:hypothetical protein